MKIEKVTNGYIITNNEYYQYVFYTFSELIIGLITQFNIREIEIEELINTLKEEQ